MPGHAREGKMRSKLREAILVGFSPTALDQTLRDNDMLRHNVATGPDYGTRVDSLVDVARQEGWLIDLCGVLAAARSGNPAVSSAIVDVQKWFIEQRNRDRAESRVAGPTIADVAPQPRKQLRPAAFLWPAAAFGTLVLAWAAADRLGVLTRSPSQSAKTTWSGSIEGKKVESDKGTGDVARGDPALLVEPGSGQSFRDHLADGKPCPMCPEMVVVPAGSFIMGSSAREEGRDDNEGPQRKITIARPFAVAKYEVTFAEWDECVDAGGCEHKPDDEGWGRGKRPVINVSWEDITKQYVPWLTRKTGKAYQLLTEAEWEYAARAGSTTRFHFGNDEKDLCTYGNVADLSAQEKNREWSVAICRDGHLNTAVVGSFKANAFGLYDMHGNVWEWVQDCYRDSFAGAPVDGAAITNGNCSSRIMRGGSWIGNPVGVRSASRSSATPDIRDNYIGFRLARTSNRTQ